MNAAHTPGPWHVGELSLDIITTKGLPVCSPSDDFNEDQWAVDARRIVACVNYCEGVSTAEIEAAPKSMNLRAILDAFDSAVAKAVS